jgi:type IV pilus assembly protein PilA
MLSTPMTTLNNRLQLALLNSKRGKSPLEKGFTLVELMIVIVIVGILSAVALPNFLSQTERAKATEGTSKLSGLLKEAHAEYQLAGTEALAVTGMSTSIANANAGSIFTYTLTAGTGEITGTATANTSSSSNYDASIESQLLHGCVNVSTGKTDISSRLLASGSGTDVSCS